MNDETSLIHWQCPLDDIGFHTAWERIRNLVLNAVSATRTKILYGQAIDDFFRWHRATEAGPLSKAVVQQYRASLEKRNLAPSSINIRLAALRKLAGEAADNGLLDADTARAIQSVKSAKILGTRAGNWLSHSQAQSLLDLPDRETLKGKRDTALLAVLLGAGLRRSEAASLTVEQLQQREARWVIVDLRGKGGRIRSVPIATWVKSAVDCWLNAAGISTGYVFKRVNKGGNIAGERLTENAVHFVVTEYSNELGTKLTPHDARRTFAQLARKAHASIEQIQMSLGHASVQTTERYLGTRLDLADAPSDRIRLRV